MTIQDAIQEYLTNANQAIDEQQIVKSGDQITVDYIGRLDDTQVFDTSIETIAQAAGTYTPQRNYNEGLSFHAGAGEMIPGFDEAVMGMKVGETKTVTIPPEKAYGERSEDLVIPVSLDQAGDVSGVKVGDTIFLNGQYPAKIAEINDQEVVFDMNSELAGKTLIFDITIKSIN